MVRGGVVVKEGGLGAHLAPRDPPKRGTPPPPPALSHSLGKADEILMVGVDVGELNVDQQQDLGGGRVSGGGGLGAGATRDWESKGLGWGGDQEEGGVGSGMGALGLWVGIWGRELGGCRWGPGGCGWGSGGAAGGGQGGLRVGAWGGLLVGVWGPIGLRAGLWGAIGGPLGGRLHPPGPWFGPRAPGCAW